MSKTYRECAIEHLKQGNLCKGYVDYIIGEVEKLEKIEQIMNEYRNGNDMEYDYLAKIREVLEKEWVWVSV